MRTPLNKYVSLLFAGAFTFTHVFSQPTLSFFNEMKSGDLVKMFSDTSLIPTLQQIRAEIRMGILDVSPERATVIQRLNHSGIPVVAWLLLPEEEGYWFHSGNGEQAMQRYEQVKQWAKENNLVFKAIGIDLELDMNDVKLVRSNPWKLLTIIPKRLYDTVELGKGRRDYARLIERIKKDGYPVESYYASFIKDETALGQTAIQQATKFLDIKTDKEIPMLYSSFMGNADGLIKVYGFDVNATAVGLGSTGGGVDTSLPALSYEQLVHDMNMASKKVDELHIFSLEGCVQKGYLQKLTGYRYDSTLTIDPAQVKSVKKLQKTFQFASTVLSHPTLLLLSLLATFVGIALIMFWLLKKAVRLIRKL